MIENIWQEFLHIIRQESGSRIVDTWLKAVTLTRWDAIEHKAYVCAPNSFVKEWIGSHYLPLLEQHLGRLFNVASISIILSDNRTTSDTEKLIPLVKQAAPVDSKTYKAAVARPISNNDNWHINPHYQFDSFVIGPHNSLAYAAAYAITEKLGSLYNPLFVYGGSGLGKTHLLHAIGNEIRKKNKKTRVLYQTADRFVNEFIGAIRFDKIHQFQAKYKNIDTLLIDDIQFISNKEQTQEAFFHIFNTLYDANKQIVFSGDSYPSDIRGIAERLTSRLEGGLVADIQTPTLETKVAILKRKADRNGTQLPDEVAHFIASHVLGNIRELEGSLIRVGAFASLTKQGITIELAKKVLLRDFSQRKTFEIDFRKIVHCVYRQYAYSVTDLRSQVRSKELARVRQITMYLMKKMTDKSLQEIGSYLGRKDHTTVRHALNKITDLIVYDKTLGSQIKRLEDQILG